MFLVTKAALVFLKYPIVLNMEIKVTMTTVFFWASHELEYILIVNCIRYSQKQDFGSSSGNQCCQFSAE